MTELQYKSIHSQQKNINFLCQDKTQGFRCNYKATGFANVTVPCLFGNLLCCYQLYSFVNTRKSCLLSCRSKGFHNSFLRVFHLYQLICCKAYWCTQNTCTLVPWDCDLSLLTAQCNKWEILRDILATLVMYCVS